MAQMGAFRTFENWEIPWEQGQQSSGTAKTSSPSPQMMQGSEEEDSRSDGIMNPQLIQQMTQQLEMQKMEDDYKRLVQQARFFLPRTLQDVAGQYGAQGSYYSSGRRGEQKEAAKKTQFDLQAAKADLEFQKQMMFLQQAAQMSASGESANTEGRSA